MSRDHSSVILDSSFGEQTRTEEDGGLAEVAAKAFVDTAAPRLLLFDETGNRAERLRDLPALVGRRSGDIRIERQQVSSKHARIEYSSSTKCCTITDLRSSNKTYLNRDAIPVEVPMSLEPDTFLLFGPAEGVYRAHQRSNGDRVDGAFDEAVAQRLVKAGRLTKGQLSEARSASGPDQPLGDAILLGGHVQPSIWCDAARETAAAPVAAGGSSSTKVILLVVVLAAAAAGVLLATGVI